MGAHQGAAVQVGARDGGGGGQGFPGAEAGRGPGRHGGSRDRQKRKPRSENSEARTGLSPLALMP